MAAETDKTIALEMAKSIIQARNANFSHNSRYWGKINDVSYWVEIYNQCLEEIRVNCTAPSEQMKE